jgi:hypothetical protein
MTEEKGKYILQNLEGYEAPHVDINERQPTIVRPGKTIIHVAPTLDLKYLQIMFPQRLTPIDGIWLNRQEAIALANAIIHESQKVKG